MKTKKRLSAVLVLCLVLVLALGGPAIAVSDSMVEDPGNPSIRFTYINTVSTSISLSSNGITATGYVQGYPHLVDDAWVFLYLERYEGGRWVVVRTWSTMSGTYYALCDGFASVPNGYVYRVRGSYYAWSGNNYEQVTGYSGNRFY